MTIRTRPLSPHLQIYKLPLTALLSITHRITGIFLSLGTVILVYWLLAIASGPDAYAQAQALLSSPYSLAALFLWTFALYFHLCNGIRHLFWDIGYGFELKTVDRSGDLVIIVSLLLTGVTWLMGSGIIGVRL